MKYFARIAEEDGKNKSGHINTKPVLFLGGGGASISVLILPVTKPGKCLE